MLLSSGKVKGIILLGLFAVSVAFLYLVSFHVDPHASMDAAYYHIMAGQLQKGVGFTEPFVWHYLNDYTCVEHPMDYWMPLGIVFYYLARLIFGIQGEVWLNIMIWGILSVAVFYEIRKAGGDMLCSVFAFCLMLFCGRTLFYLLTTDNIAFYALFGFLFFKMLGNETGRWPITAVIGGLAALMRIEGIIIAFIGAAFEFYKDRRLKMLAGYCLVLLLVLMPWMIRNHLVLGTVWTSNSKALFLREYSDLFSTDFPGTLSNYLELGFDKIIAQKAHGIWISLLNLVAMPGMFILYPLWLAGMIFCWKNYGKFYSILLIIFIGLCGLLFTLQSEQGTAMHISAFFYPHFAVLSGFGLFSLRRNFRPKEAKFVVLTIFLLIWAAAFTAVSTGVLKRNYSDISDPYRLLIAKQEFRDDEIIASDDPVRIYYLCGAKGIVIPEGTLNWLDTVEKYKCDVVLLDKRLSGRVVPEDLLKNWRKKTVCVGIEVFRRILTAF